MRTSGEKVRILDEAERLQSVSYSHVRPLSGLYTVVCLREGKRGTCLFPLSFWGPPSRYLNEVVPICSNFIKGAEIYLNDFDFIQL